MKKERKIIRVGSVVLSLVGIFMIFVAPKIFVGISSWSMIAGVIALVMAGAGELHRTTLKQVADFKKAVSNK